MTPVRILALADEVDEAIGPSSIQTLRPDLVVGCGDLPAEYLEYVVTLANVPLLWVPGNHDPDVRRAVGPLDLPLPAHAALIPVPGGDPPGPAGCIPLDGRFVRERGLVLAGLGGSIRYRGGPNQYTQKEMRARARRLRRRLGLRRKALDVLVTHSPPLGVGDGDDPAHQGFAAFGSLIERLSPKVLVHGHVHPLGPRPREHRIGRTRVVNAAPHHLLEVEP